MRFSKNWISVKRSICKLKLKSVKDCAASNFIDANRSCVHKSLENTFWTPSRHGQGFSPFKSKISLAVSRNTIEAINWDNLPESKRTRVAVYLGRDRTFCATRIGSMNPPQKNAFLESGFTLQMYYDIETALSRLFLQQSLWYRYISKLADIFNINSFLILPLCLS